MCLLQVSDQRKMKIKSLTFSFLQHVPKIFRKKLSLRYVEQSQLQTLLQIKPQIKK